MSIKKREELVLQVVVLLGFSVTFLGLENSLVADCSLLSVRH